jgi:hypothetical protein
VDLGLRSHQSNLEYLVGRVPSRLHPADLADPVRLKLLLADQSNLEYPVGRVPSRLHPADLVDPVRLKQRLADLVNLVVRV